MVEKETLLTLAERCEGAEQYDTLLDADIAVATTPGMFCDGSYVGFTGAGDMRQPPCFTASLDAALTLVPEGWTWSLYGADEYAPAVAYCVPNMGRLPWPEWIDDIRAATPALALCAAALRARAMEAQ